MFKWILTDNDTGQVERLDKDPKGFDEMTLKHQRDEKYHGITEDFSSEFGFYCKGGGKELIDDAYLDKGQEADVTLTLDVYCNGSFTRLFTGKLNFTTYRQEWISGVLYSFLDMDKQDIARLINSREDLKVDLLRSQSLDGVNIPDYPYSSYEISMHSKVIKLLSSWENSGNTVVCNAFESDTLYEMRIAEWLRDKGELKESNDVTASVEGVISGQGTNIAPVVEFSEDYEFPFDVTFSWNVSGTMYDKSFLVGGSECAGGTPTGVSRGTNSVDVTLSLFKGTNSGDLVTNTTRWNLVTIPAYSTLQSVTAQNFSASGSITTSVNRGEKLWLFWIFSYRVLVGGSAFDIQWTFDYTNADISVVANTTTPASSCTGIAIHEAWSKLASIITDQPLAFYSEFFGRTDSNIVYPSDGCGSKTAITSGLNIRGFTSSSIATSLKDMFDACHSVWGVGLGIEDYQNNRVLRVEPVYYFYSDTVVLTLENVPNIQMTHLSDKVYNKIVLGFQKWNTESTNGLDEPLTRIEFVVPQIKSNKNAFELINPYVGGMYAIEQTRRKNHLDYATEDTGYDENLFFICLNKDDLTIPEKNENFVSVSGLLSPETAYNLRLMLSSTYDRVKYLFTAGLTKLATMASQILMPAEGEGNESVLYTFIPDGCDGDHFGTQQSNGRAGRFPSPTARRNYPLWEPEEFTFDYPLGFADYLALINNPYGLIRFSDGQDNFYSGWIRSLEYNLRMKTASFTILRKYE